MTRTKLVLLVAVAVVCLALFFAYYPRLLKVRGEGLGARFKELYLTDPEFREAVDRLREMALDPEADYDRELAAKLFNSILKKLGLPEVDPIHFRYGKSVRDRALKVPVSVECTAPGALDLVVVQPLVDVESGNGLEAVYVCQISGPPEEVFEVTLVFKDEDKPPSESLDDVWYDVWRLVVWGRLEDIETFYVVRRRGLVYLEFKGLALVLNDTMGLRMISPIGSGSSGFDKSAHVEIVERSRGSPIVVYVNTWNHAMGLSDANPGLEKVKFDLASVKVKVGSRLDAENEISDLVYVGEVPRLP